MAGRAYWASPHFLGHLKGQVLILMYHRVIPRSEIATTYVQPGMYVTPQTLEHHLRFLTAHFELLSFQDLLDKWRQDSLDSSARYCVVTFDDGWRDNYLYAYPLLRAYHVPAIIFLPTDLIGTRDWLWPDQLGHLLHRHRSRAGARLSQVLAPFARRYPGLTALNGRGMPEVFDSIIELAKTMSDEARDEFLQSLDDDSGSKAPHDRRFLDWDQAREMSRDGIAFGSHSCTHAILSGLDGTRLRHELRQSLDVLREQRVNHVPVISYPNGDYTDTVAAEAGAEGYQAAVTTDPGLESRRPADLFRLRRIAVHEDVSRSAPLLALHVARVARPRTGIR